MRVQSDHWAIILDFCEQHPQIIANKFNAVGGRNELNDLWAKLTIKLNALGLGEKTVEGWKKTITDWKSKTKAKAGSIKTYQNKTGGGTQCNLSLTSFEERLLMIMGKTSYEGNPENIERGMRKRKLFDEHVAIQKPSPAAVHSFNIDHTYPKQDRYETIVRDYELPLTNETVITDQPTTYLSELPRVHSLLVPYTSHVPIKDSNRFTVIPSMNPLIAGMSPTTSKSKDIPTVHMSPIPTSSTSQITSDVTQLDLTPMGITPRKLTSNYTNDKTERRRNKKDGSEKLQIMHNELLDELRNINANINSIAESLKSVAIHLNK